MEYKRLNKVCNLYYGKNLPGKDFLEEGFPVFGANGIIGSYSEYTHESPMLLVSCRGENSGVINISPPKAFITNNSIICEIIDDEVDQTFLFYFLKAQQRERLLSGSAQPQITTFDLGRFKLYNLPPKSEQTAIAAILTKVDDAIAATESSIRAAEKLKQALMQNLLTGKLRPDGSWRTEEEFEQTKIGSLPKEWLVKTVKEISTLVTDGEHQTPERTESGYYLLSARNIKNGYLDLSNVDYVPEKELLRIQKRCNPQAGDILISCSGTIGNVCIVPEGLNAGMVRSAALVKLNYELIESRFAELIFQSFSLQNQMKVSVASSVQGNIFQGAIKKLRIPYPPTEAERTAIVNKIQGFSEAVKQKQAKILTLQRLKKSLMQNLLTGKVRVAADQLTSLLAEPA